jgi:hypothetical protein
MKTEILFVFEAVVLGWRGDLWVSGRLQMRNRASSQKRKLRRSNVGRKYVRRKRRYVRIIGTVNGERPRRGRICDKEKEKSKRMQGWRWLLHPVLVCSLCNTTMPEVELL